MQLQEVNLDEILEESKGKRGRPRIFTEEDVAQTVAILEDGRTSGRNAAVSAEEPYETKEQARSHALKLRDLVVQASDFTEDEITTKVWISERGPRWTVYYKSPRHGVGRPGDPQHGLTR